MDGLGHILTNEHVIRDASRIEVTLADGLKIPAEVRGRDALNDIALLKVEAPAERLRPVILGDSATLRVGQLAVAIGNPFGFTRTLTVGVVSGVGRPIEDAGRRPLLDMIQTDAAINPGNSGGPLLNSRGEVIGITTLIDRSQLSVGFAVPINTAMQILPSLISGQKVARPWLGDRGGGADAAAGRAVGSDRRTRHSGARIDPRRPSRPADSGRVGGQPGQWRRDSGDRRQGGHARRGSGGAIDPHTVGEVVAVTVVRGGDRQTVQVTLGEYPEGR